MRHKVRAAQISRKAAFTLSYSTGERSCLHKGAAAASQYLPYLHGMMPCATNSQASLHQNVHSVSARDASAGFYL
jgi:hypothetical protein